LNEKIFKFVPAFIFAYILVLLCAGLWPFNFLAANGLYFNSTHGLFLEPLVTAYTTTPPEKLTGMKQFTVFLSLVSSQFSTNGYARILTYSIGEDEMNLMVGQWENGLVFKVRSANRLHPIHFETSDIFKNGKKCDLTIVFNGDKLILYKDGKKRNVRKTGPLNFSGWNGSYPLVIGSEADGKFPWAGQIYSIKIFDQALSKKEIRDLSERKPNVLPLIDYSFEEADKRTIRDHGVGQPADMTVPHYFKPYKRTFLESPWKEFLDYRHNMKDLLINVIGFIPLGFLLPICFARKRFSFIKALFLSILIGFSISITIEALQAFLPTRSSGTADLITNTSGTAMGVFLYKIFKRFIPYYEPITRR
jgi:VanZ family protein